MWKTYTKGGIYFEFDHYFIYVQFKKFIKIHEYIFKFVE